MTINAAKLGLSILKCCHCGALRPQTQMQAFCHHCMGPACSHTVSKGCMVCGVKKREMEAIKRQSEVSHHYNQFTAH